MSQLASSITFETGDLTQFDATSDTASNSSIAADAAAAYAGSYGMLLDADESGDGSYTCRGQVNFTWSTSDVLVVDFWWKRYSFTQDGYDTANAKAVFSLWGSSGGHVLAMTRQNNDLYLSYYDTSYSYSNTSLSFSPSTGTWYKFRIIIDLTGSNPDVTWEYSTNGTSFTTIGSETITDGRLGVDETLGPAYFGLVHVNAWEKAQYVEYFDGIELYDAVPTLSLSLNYDSYEADLESLYSFRRRLTSWTGNVVRLRRSSDDAEADFGYDDNNELNLSAISSWLGGSNGYVVTWYDQSGNGKHMTQSTASAQPLFVASLNNSLPGVQFDGSDDLLECTTFTYAIDDLTELVVGGKTNDADDGTGQYLSRQRDGDNRYYFTVADYRIGTGDVSYSGGDFDGWHTFMLVSDAGSQNVYVDGSAQGADTQSPSYTFTIMYLGGGNSGANDTDTPTTFSAVEMSEVVFFDTTQTAISTIEAIASDYWFASSAIDITPNVITSGETHYQPALTFGAVTITPNAITSGETHYQPAVSAGTNIDVNVITSTEAHYQPAIAVGAVNIDVNAITSGEAHYQPLVVYALDVDFSWVGAL